METRKKVKISSTVRKKQVIVEQPMIPTIKHETDVNKFEQEGGLNLGQFIELINRRKITIVTTMIAVAMLATYWSRTRPPIHEGKFQILVEPVTVESETVSAISGQKEVANQDVGQDAKASKDVLDYPTQISILQKPKLLLPVVKSLNANFPKLDYDGLISNLKIARTTDPLNASVETKILEVTYEAEAREQVEQVLDKLSKTYINYSLNERQVNLKRALIVAENRLPQISSQVQSIEKQLQQFRTINGFVDPKEATEKIEVQLGEIKQQKIANDIELLQTTQLYNSLQKELKLNPSTAIGSTVLSDAPEYLKLLDEVQKLDSEIAAKSAELTEDHPSVVALRDKRENLMPLLRQQKEKALGPEIAGAIGNSELPYQNPLRQGLSKQFVDASLQLNVLKAKEKGIIAAQNTLSQRMQELPSITRQYATLDRNLQTATEQEKQTKKVVDELRLNAERKELPWDLIAPPVITQKPSQGLAKTLILGTILGAILGLGIAILKDKFKDVIYTLRDLQSELKMAILGTIPVNQDINQREYLSAIDNYPNPHESSTVIEDDSTPIDREYILQKTEKARREKAYQSNSFVEAFRSLYSQIRLVNPDNPINSFVISSCSPHEGKTTIAFYLARAAAALGKRVLLVSADLRSPGLDRLLCLEGFPGLTNVISEGGDYDLVSRCLFNEGTFSVLAAGTLPSDSTSILGSLKMQHLMHEFHENYDLVIYDAPPLSLADPMLIAPLTDGLIIVTKLGTVSRSSLVSTLQSLSVSKVPILGAIANGVNAPANNYYYGNLS